MVVEQLILLAIPPLQFSTITAKLGKKASSRQQYMCLIASNFSTP